MQEVTLYKSGPLEKVGKRFGDNLSFLIHSAIVPLTCESLRKFVSARNLSRNKKIQTFSLVLSVFNNFSMRKNCHWVLWLKFAAKVIPSPDCNFVTVHSTLRQFSLSHHPRENRSALCSEKRLRKSKKCFVAVAPRKITGEKVQHCN